MVFVDTGDNKNSPRNMCPNDKLQIIKSKFFNRLFKILQLYLN